MSKYNDKYKIIVHLKIVTLYFTLKMAIEPKYYQVEYE